MTTPVAIRARHPTEIRMAVEKAFDEHGLIDYACAEIERLERAISDGNAARTLLQQAFNAMDEVRCTLNDRGDKTGISSVLAMTLADVQRDIKAFLEEK